MDGRYGPSYFSEVVGITRSSLHKMKKTGRLVPCTNRKGNSYYTPQDFLNPHIVALMEEKGKTIPESVMALLTAAKKPPELKVVNKEAEVIPINRTTTFDRIPEGLLTKSIKPLIGMTQAEGVYWRSLMKELVSMGHFNKGDIYTLREYCSYLVQIDGLKVDIIVQGNYDDMGKVNPLLPLLDKYRTSAVNLATKLYLTPQSRKDLKIPEKVSVGQQDWDNVLKA